MAENKDTGKKQLLLRLSPSLWQDLAAWAEDDFRSINGQIEYLLSESVMQRKKGKYKGTDENRD
ncbi:MAG: Arc family DNA-binding protein [Eubacteriales bacterium]